MSNHELDESKAEYIPGRGFKGPCKLCGEMLIWTRRVRLHEVPPGMGKLHLSKKERLKQRKQGEAGLCNVCTHKGDVEFCKKQKKTMGHQQSSVRYMLCGGFCEGEKA